MRSALTAAVREKPVLRDVALWLLLCFPSLVWALDGRLHRLPLGQLVVPPLVLAGIVAAGRRYPAPALAAGVALTLLDPLTPVDRFTFTVVALSYLTAIRIPDQRHVQRVIAAVVVGGMLGACALAPWQPTWMWAYTLAGLPFLVVFPWLVGRYRRHHRELMLGGWELAGDLERAHQLGIRQAQLLERARIAQDMHDSLGHELSLIALRAGELEVSPDLEQRHRRAAGGVREAAGTATDRLREIIGVLADGSPVAALDPAPGTVDEVVARARASGLEVSLEISEPVAHLSPMAPMSERAIHRVVQESLTNAAKHAPGTGVRVELVHGRPDIEITITNPLPVPRPRTVASGNLGLVGLQERVRVAGGTFDAGEVDGVFRVHARVPRLGPPGEPGVAVRRPAATSSMAARRLAGARRSARRGFLLAFGIPVAAGVVVLLAATGFVYQTFSSVLAPRTFAGLRIGEEWAALEPRLPVHSYTELPDDLRDLPPPPGARCLHYVSSADLFADAPIYRLCLVRDQLVSKDEFPRGGTRERLSSPATRPPAEDQT